MHRDRQYGGIYSVAAMVVIFRYMFYGSTDNSGGGIEIKGCEGGGGGGVRKWWFKYQQSITYGIDHSGPVAPDIGRNTTIYYLVCCRSMVDG